MRIQSSAVFSEQLSFDYYEGENLFPRLMPSYSLIYNLEGESVCKTPNCSASLNAEEFVWIRPDTLFSIIARPGARYLVFSLSRSIVRPVISDEKNICPYYVGKKQDTRMTINNSLRELLASIFYYYSLADEQQDYLLWGDCMKLISLIRYAGANQEFNFSDASEIPASFSNVFPWITSHYDENITLKQAADITFLSAGYFEILFRKATGQTFLQYLTSLRISHAKDDLLNTDLSITEIAMKNGFRSSNNLIRAFKTTLAVTPGEFRKKKQKEPADEQKPAAELSGQFDALLRYRNGNTFSHMEKILTRQMDSEMLSISCGGKTSPLIHNWNKILNIGMASDALMETVREQIRFAGQFHSYTYIRLAGILDSNILYVDYDRKGNLICNFIYLDNLLDFCLKEGFRPYLEFSFMPKILAKNPDAVLSYNSIHSMPADLGKWADLIGLILDHLLQRYGYNEMKNWIFSPMRSTYTFKLINAFQEEEYLDLYAAFFREAKQKRELPVCGFGNDLGMIRYDHASFLEKFLKFTKENRIIPDYISVQSFNNAFEGYPFSSHAWRRTFRTQDMQPASLSSDPEYTNHLSSMLKETVLETLGYPVPLILEDWGTSQWQRDPRNDTAHQAVFQIKTILESCSNFSIMAGMKLTDLMEETPYKQAFLHGGWGMLTADGIPKSGFHAVSLLDRLGNEILQKGSDYIVAKEGPEIQVLFFYYCHTTSLSRHNLRLEEDPYSAFTKTPDRQIDLTLRNLESGTYTLNVYDLSPKHGCIYSEWKKAGAPDPLTQDARSCLLHTCFPQFHTQEIEIADIFDYHTVLVPHEVKLLILHPVRHNI